MGFGRNQQIAMGALTAPFLVATIALFCGKCTFAEWSGFNQFLVPVIVGIALGVSGVQKIFERKGANEKKSSMDMGDPSSDSLGPSSPVLDP